MGAAMLALGAAIAAATILAGSERWWRLGLFVPFWMAALGLFQAKEKT